MAQQARIYTVAGYATLAKSRYPILRVAFSLSPNAVPTASVTIDTKPMQEETSGRGSVVAEIPDIREVARLYQRADEIRLNKETRKIGLRLSVAEEGGANHKLELDDWIITSVGMGNFLSDSGPYSLNIVIAHPANVLAETPCRPPPSGVPSAPLSPIIQGASDVLAASDMAFRTVLEELTSSGSADNTPSGALALAKFKEGVDALPKLLGWVGDVGWPALYAGAQPAVRGTLYDAAKSADHPSFMKWIQSVVIETWGTTMVPTYTEKKLAITPFEPWGAPTFAISVEDILEPVFPGIDYLPSKGVYFPMTAVINAGQMSTLDGSYAAMLQAPMWIEEKLKDAIGNVEAVSLPSWAMAAQRDPLGLSTIGGPPGAGATGLDTPSSASETTDGLVEAGTFALWAADTETLLKQFFVENHRRGVTARFRCPLLLRDENNLAYIPGRVWSLHALPSAEQEGDNEPGDEVLRFYATGLEHVLDAKQNMCYTTVSGAYLRAPNEPDLAAIPKGETRSWIYAGGS